MIADHDREALERLARYGARPAFAHDRPTWTSDGRISYKLKRPWPDGRTHLVSEPVAFLRRLPHTRRASGYPSAVSARQPAPAAASETPLERPWRDAKCKPLPVHTSQLARYTCPNNFGVILLNNPSDPDFKSYTVTSLFGRADVLTAMFGS